MVLLAEQVVVVVVEPDDLSQQLGAALSAIGEIIYGRDEALAMRKGRAELAGAVGYNIFLRIIDDHPETPHLALAVLGDDAADGLLGVLRLGDHSLDRRGSR